MGLNTFDVCKCGVWGIRESEHNNRMPQRLTNKSTSKDILIAQRKPHSNVT